MSDRENRLNLAQVLVQEMQALGIVAGDFKLKPAEHAAALEEIRTEILKREHKLTALCFSGGGIRSATFCLGVLQQLAKFKLLSKFDYLSTVSGGGFIGGWLKAWTLREGEDGRKLGIEGVEKRIREATEEPKPIRFLRYYSNYLSPKLGLLSADTWTIAATYVRNLVLNWLVLVPLLMLPLLAPMMYLAVQREVFRAGYSHWWLFGFGVLLLLYGATRFRRGLPSAGQGKLSQGQFIRHCLLPLALAVGAFTVWYQEIQAKPELVHGLNFWSYCPWLSRTIAPDSLFGFSSLLGITVSFNLAAFVAGKIFDAFGSSSRKEGAARYATWWKELGAMMLTAVVAAGLVWSWIQVFSAVDGRSIVYACFAMPALLAVFTLSEVFYIGVASYFTDEMDREFWARAGAWDLIVTLGWIALSALALYGPMLIESLGPIAKAALFGTGAAAGGFAAKMGHSVLTAALAGAGGKKESLSGRLLSKLALPVALLVFVVILMAFLAYLCAWLLWTIGFRVSDSSFLLGILQSARLLSEQRDLTPLLQASGPQEILAGAPLWCVAAAAILLALVQYGMGRVIHVNKFSLHAAYGNRIMRAYLGASRGKDRRPHPFTGFDPHDNVSMTEFTRDEVKRPLHIVNIALNLVRGENLAWQERKAASFTASALHCGGYDVDYRPTAHYGGGQGMTLGTAVTISGAAFSPNAGYHSSPLLTFVMAFFNVRLGWWLGNPSRATAREPGPTHAAWPLIAETFGLTDDKHKWVYLSDGGHFDNLGLYEMVARRVRQIVVIDAGADPKYEFEDLGNAIRKIRADFGISIEREGKMKIARRLADGPYCATFRIRYSDVHKIGNEPEDSDGRLLYIKPVLNGSESQDVTQYASGSDDFPHESTADQFYTESQFESYRVLGIHEIRTIVAGSNVNTIGDLIDLGGKHSVAAKT
jgi:hypothetical protein